MKKRAWTKRNNIYKINFLLKDEKKLVMLDRSNEKPKLEKLEEKFKVYFPNIDYSLVRGINYQILTQSAFRRLFNQINDAK